MLNIKKVKEMSNRYPWAFQPAGINEIIRKAASIGHNEVTFAYGRHSVRGIKNQLEKAGYNCEVVQTYLDKQNKTNFILKVEWYD